MMLPMPRTTTTDAGGEQLDLVAWARELEHERVDEAN